MYAAWLMLVLVAVAAEGGGAPAVPARRRLIDTPGVLSRCNKTEVCSAEANEQWPELIFLCCEDDSGWAASHVTVHIFLYFMSQSWVVVVLAFYVFESLESFTLYIPFLYTGRESLVGSALIDPVQGAIGLLLAMLMVQIFRPPRLFVPWGMGAAAAGRRCRCVSRWPFWRSALITAVFVFAYYFQFRSTEGDAPFPLNILPLSIHLLIILGVMPCVYPRPRRLRRFFWAWAFIHATIHLANLGWYLLNTSQYFQIWLVIGLQLLVLLPCVGCQ